MHQRELADWLEARGLVAILDDNDEWIVHIRDSKGCQLEAYARVGEATRVQRIWFKDNSMVGGRQLGPLEGLAFLEDLAMRRCEVAGSDLGFLRTLERIVRLQCVLWVDGDTGLSHVGELTNLKLLCLSGSFGISNAGMPALSHLHNLRYLEISYTDISSGIAVVHQMPMLEELYLSGTKVGPAEIGHLSGLKNLHTLYLPCLHDDESLASLEDLTCLQTLSVGGKCGERGLQSLAKLPKLTRLYLIGMDFTQDVRQALLQFRHLKYLCLDEVNCADEELKELAGRARFRVDRSDTRDYEAEREKRYQYSEWKKRFGAGQKAAGVEVRE